MIRSLVSAGTGKMKKDIQLSKMVDYLANPRSDIWLDVEAPSDADIAFLEKTFGLHPLAIEDALTEHQRPKVEEFSNFLFIVTRCMSANINITEQLNFFVGKNCLITIHMRPNEAVSTIMKRCESNPYLLAKGADFLAYSIIDMTIDELFNLLNKMGERIERLEERMMQSSSPQLLNTLLSIKKDVLSVRRMVWPMRDRMGTLARRPVKFIKPSTAVYFRDVEDHVLRISDAAEMHREMLASMMEVYLSVTSNQLNRVVKRLTAVSVLFMLPTLIASIYGMNFVVIPGAEMEFGFELSVVGMIVVFVLLYVFFKKIDWF